MTRYVCAHPSHRRGSRIDTVDVTAQVRLERSLLPRTEAYLAFTEDVVDAVMHLPNGDAARHRRIEQLISGVSEPQELPVVLMSRRSILRQPGRYQLEDLRTRDPEVERVLAEVDPAFESPRLEEDVVVIHDEPPAGPTGSTAQSPTATLTRERQQAPAVPEGVYPLHELAGNLAMASRTESDVISAIRHTTPTTTGRAVHTDPWRVVVTCPRPDGSPPAAHEVLFTGSGHAEPAIVYGTPVDAWDAELEASAVQELTPSAEVSRVERRLWALLGVEVFVALFLLALGWASGGLALAARETAGWLGLALILAGTAIAFAAAPLFWVRDRSLNMNDTYTLEYAYRTRIDLYRLAAGISAALFAFAVLVGVVPPLFADSRPIPAATVTFDTSTQPITATVRVRATGFGTDDELTVTIREYASANDPTGALLGHTTRHGTSSGRMTIAETVAVDANAGYMSVLVSHGAPDSACTPAVTGTPGCTVLAVPQFTPTAPRLSLSASSTITTQTPGTVEPSPTVSGSPSVTTTP